MLDTLTAPPVGSPSPRPLKCEIHPVGMTASRSPAVTLRPRKVSRISDPQVERIDALFVQSATAFSSGPGRIMLHGLADSTVYFADRPRREVGHMPSHKFVELWESGANTFSVDPPNAVLSFLDVKGESPADAVIVLRQPRLEDDTLTYDVEILDGTLAGPSRAVHALHRRIRTSTRPRRQVDRLAGRIAPLHPEWAMTSTPPSTSLDGRPPAHQSAARSR